MRSRWWVFFSKKLTLLNDKAAKVSPDDDIVCYSDKRG